MNQTIGRLLGTGHVAEVFEWGSCVLKLYKSTMAKPTAFREAAVHAAAEAFGLPVPKVWSVQEIGGRWGVVFDRVKLPSFAEQMLSNPDEVQQYVECIVRLHMRVHALPAVHLADLKVRLTDNIVATGVLAEPRRRDLLEGIARMPDGDRLCHGDFHPMNILGEPSPVIIDWPDARRGDPAADVCRACHCAVLARYSRPPLRVAALRLNSRETVDAARPSRRAISRTPKSCASASAISSHSANAR